MVIDFQLIKHHTITDLHLLQIGGIPCWHTRAMTSRSLPHTRILLCTWYRWKHKSSITLLFSSRPPFVLLTCLSDVYLCRTVINGIRVSRLRLRVYPAYKFHSPDLLGLWQWITVLHARVLHVYYVKRFLFANDFHVYSKLFYDDIGTLSWSFSVFVVFTTHFYIRGLGKSELHFFLLNIMVHFKNTNYDTSLKIYFSFSRL